MKYILPLCPTTNQMYSKSRYGVYKTSDTRIWEKEASYVITQSKKHKKILGDVYVGVEFFLKRDRDVDNLKLIMDSLEDNGVIENDSQVKHLNIKKFTDKENPRVEVTVEAML